MQMGIGTPELGRGILRKEEKPQLNREDPRAAAFA
jgi:hypothetical protein